MSGLQVRKAFVALTGPQVNRRNKAFEDGWRILDHWCGEYLVGYKGECVARVTKHPSGLLSIKML